MKATDDKTYLLAYTMKKTHDKTYIIICNEGNRQQNKYNRIQWRDRRQNKAKTEINIVRLALHNKEYASVTGCKSVKGKMQTDSLKNNVNQLFYTNIYTLKKKQQHYNFSSLDLHWSSILSEICYFVFPADMYWILGFRSPRDIT